MASRVYIPLAKNFFSVYQIAHMNYCLRKMTAVHVGRSKFHCLIFVVDYFVEYNTTQQIGNVQINFNY